MPGFINSMLNRREEHARVYVPPDANTLLATVDHCLQATNCINLIIGSKLPLPQWLTMDEAREHVRVGASAWDWASSNDDGDPDLVLASCGTIPTIELLAAASLLKEDVPDLKVRFVNVTNLFALAAPGKHPDAMPAGAFGELFTKGRPVIFNFHGYPSAVHQLIHRRPNQERFHVRGYAEEGTTTTPFDLLAMNGVDRYQLAIEALSRVDLGISDNIGGMSGAFAVRNIGGAQEAIAKYREQLAEHRRYVREVGNDPPELTNWVWPGSKA
jgi:xylulose-5-phosphate/fructose-6-phosphate phosphoketolase